MQEVLGLIDGLVIIVFASCYEFINFEYRMKIMASAHWQLATVSSSKAAAKSDFVYG